MPKPIEFGRLKRRVREEGCAADPLHRLCFIFWIAT
jgi:hypothetical protein